MAALLLGPAAALATDGAMVGEEHIDEDVSDEDADAHQQMLELSGEGNQLYEAGQFQEAAEVYQRAYEAYPQPILLKNQMITRYLIEECETAIELGERFIDSGEGSAEDEEDVEAVFGECSLDLARHNMSQQDWIGAEDWLDFGEPYLFEAQLREEAEELRAELDDQIGDAESVEEIEEPGPATPQIAAWSSIGAGVGLVVGAGLWHRSWENSNQELTELSNELGEDDPEVEEMERQLQDDYRTVRWAVPTMYGLGGVALLAGTGMLVWPMLDGGEDEAGAMIRPQIGADRAGAVFSVTF